MATPSSPPPPQDPDQNPNHHHHHHDEHHSSPSPSLSPPSSNAKPLQSVSPTKKPQPVPWSHQETTNLIEAYQEKWYSLKRGQLKASQWEEVAVTVAARCGYDDPTKTAVQCRHKIEKLRKRYRAEKQKVNPHAWEYFDLMDRLERGPLPISARPVAMFQNYDPMDDGEEDYGNDEEEEEEEINESRYNGRRGERNGNKSKSINRLLRGHVGLNKPKLSWDGARVSGFLQKPALRKRKERVEKYESDGEEGEEEVEEEEVVVVGGGGRGMVGELAAEIKAFAERLERMENKKVEMMRETERYRMEMENKRMEMILESQRKIVDTIGRAFGGSKKLKMAQDI